MNASAIKDLHYEGYLKNLLKCILIGQWNLKEFSYIVLVVKIHYCSSELSYGYSLTMTEKITLLCLKINDKLACSQPITIK